MLIALDRQEKGQGARSAVQEVEALYGIPVFSIVKLEHLIDYLAGSRELGDNLASVQAYRAEYGVPD